MKLFKIASPERIFLETDSVVAFRKELQNHFNFYKFEKGLELTYIGKNVLASDDFNYDLDDFNFDYYMDDVSFNYIEYVTQDNIEDTSGLTVVENDWLDDFDGAENEMSMVPVSDENYCYNGFLGFGSKAHMTNYYW